MSSYSSLSEWSTDSEDDEIMIYKKIQQEEIVGQTPIVPAEPQSTAATNQPLPPSASTDKWQDRWLTKEVVGAVLLSFICGMMVMCRK